MGPGPKTRKKYLLVACTHLLTYYFLGDRSMASFEAFVFPDLTGVVVHDRYQNYDKFPGITHQLCCQHLLRDLADAAQSYPGAIWPVQAAEALQALIHAANLAREQGLPAVPDADAGPHLRLFRHGVLAGLSAVRRLPGTKAQQPPARLRSEHVTRHRYAIRGYISTAAKHGTSVFTALRDALTGNAWMPPIPAST